MSRAVVDENVMQFLAPVMEFVLHNATDEPVAIMYDGETRIVPPINAVTQPHPKFEDVCYSAKDSEGNWIPGTLVVRDVVRDTVLGEFGEKRNFWSAASAIKHSLQIDVKRGTAEGPYAKRGLSVLPANPTPATVAKVAAAGRARYEEWIVDQARATVEQYNDRNSALRAAGHAPIPLGRDYDRAAALLNARQNKEISRAQATLGVAETLAQQAESAALEEEKSRAEEAEVEDYLEKKIQELAQEASAPREMTPDELVARITADKKAMELLKEKYKVRKLRGNKKPEAVPEV